MRRFDVCVIGSGAAGGVMAKELCEGGAKVIMLEGGRVVTPAQFLSHKWPYELPYRGLRQEKQALFFPPDVTKYIRYQDCDDIRVVRARVVGGRTLHWNAVALRYAPEDFRQRSVYGVEEDWPLTYEDLEPYYDRIERIIGVCGEDDGLKILPAGKHYLPPLRPWRCSEYILDRALKHMGIPMISVRKALNTIPYDNRPPCHYCGHCQVGCDVAAIFTSPDCMLPKAEATGNFTLRPNALARAILVDREGLARAVSFIDTVTKNEEQVQARIVVVCGSTVESPRLLLDSCSPQHPNGLANSNGMVGRYLHGHIAGDHVFIYLDDLAGTPPVNQDAAMDMVYVPRYNQLFGKHDYAGGWQLQVNTGSYMFPVQARWLPGYGEKFKERVRWMEPGYMMYGSWGKAISRPENYVTVDPHQVDDYGIPIPVVHFHFGEMDYALWRAADESMLEIASYLKGTVFNNYRTAPRGFASHAVGTVRMGKNAKTSVLNSFCQTRDVKNLFVADGSCFTTSSEKNPTLTIMALCMRAADYIKEQRRRGEL